MNPSLLPLRFWLFALCFSAFMGGVAGWQIGRGFSEEPEVAIAQEPAVNQRTAERVALPTEKEEEKMFEPAPEPPPTTEEPALPVAFVAKSLRLVCLCALCSICSTSEGLGNQ